MTTRTSVVTAELDHPSSARQARLDWAAAGAHTAMWAGAALVAWSAAIHLDLWRTGYRSITTIGPLFLAQAVSGFVVAAVVAATRRLLPALAGIGFLVATLGGLVVSVNVGLFGFRDSLAAPFARLSVVVEATGIVVLALAAVLRVVVVRRAPSDH